jgi:phage regulator Rha-like protein
MKEDFQTFSNIRGRSHRIVVQFTVSRCMQFFIGLMKRFGNTQKNLFRSPEQKSTSKPLKIRA